jgi:hypothetical protein
MKKSKGTEVKMPAVDCDAVGQAMRLHEVDVEDLLARVWAVSGFAGGFWLRPVERPLAD